MTAHSFWLPIEVMKADTQDGAVRKFKGMASTAHLDSDGEMLEQGGFDLTDFKWINWEHSPDADKAVGFITFHQITKSGLYIEGEFRNTKTATQVYELALDGQAKGERFRLGLSVEGQVTLRDKKDPKKVLKARLFGAAICKTPKNSNTWVEIIKSFSYISPNESPGDDQVLSKGEIYKAIFNKYPHISPQQAKAIYQKLDI